MNRDLATISKLNAITGQIDQYLTDSYTIRMQRLRYIRIYYIANIYLLFQCRARQQADNIIETFIEQVVVIIDTDFTGIALREIQYLVDKAE